MKTAGFGAYWADNLRVIASKAELAKYWVMISSSGDFLRAAPSYILIRSPWEICFGEEAGSSDVWRSLYYMTRPEAPKDAVMGQVDVQHDPTPQHGPQMPQATALAPKTIPQRL
ncbi:hypothetical protein Tco_0073246 [Tanacetum coccineum]